MTLFGAEAALIRAIFRGITLRRGFWAAAARRKPEPPVGLAGGFGRWYSIRAQSIPFLFIPHGKKAAFEKMQPFCLQKQTLPADGKRSLQSLAEGIDRREYRAGVRSGGGGLFKGRPA